MNFSNGKLIRPVEAFALLLLVIFTTELAVMELLAPSYEHLGVIPAGLLDATLLVATSSAPLWIIFSPVFAGRLRRDNAARRALGIALFQLVSVFFFIELLIMLFLPGLLTGLNSVMIGLADAGLTAVLTAPFLWWLLVRLERAHHRVSLSDLLESPRLLYLLVLYVIFLSALLQELLVSDMFVPALQGPHHVFEALMLMLITAPFVWIFVARPLRRSVQSERAWARAVYEQVIDAIVLADDKERILALNPAAQRIFGYTEAELVGRPLETLFEAGQPSIEPMLQAAADSQGHSVGNSAELASRHRYGDTLTMDVSISCIQIAGRDDFLLIMRDISERKRAEEALRERDLRFREVYEQSEDAVLFFKTGSDYVIEANATTEQLFGYSKDEMRGQGLDRVLRGEDLARVQQAIGELHPGESLFFKGLTGLRRDGTKCIISLRAKIMTLQGVDLVYCTLRDVTDRVRMEEEARDIQARLIQANKMTSLGLLVSGVAHEINNPNNLIMNNAQLLTAGWEDGHKVLREYYRENGDFLLGGIPFSELDDQTPQLLAGILDGSRRINQIVGSLKHYARPVSPGVAADIDVNQMVTAAVAILQHELTRHTGRFICELADGLPPVSGNGQQLSQVVINLLMNACQALPDRDHGICLATGCDAIAGQVSITVRDEGVGITAEAGRRIMEPFFTTKLENGGTGLGLSISRSIVNEHGGELEFSSTPGEGSIFTVRLPVAGLVGEMKGRR